VLQERRVHTTLPVLDLDAACVFYEGTLGFAPTNETPTGIFFECGEGTRFVLSKTSGRPSGAHTQMAFTVDDLVSEVRDLKDRGIVFEEYESPKTVDGVFEGPFLKAAWFKDPDGNILALMQPLTAIRRRKRTSARRRRIRSRERAPTERPAPSRRSRSVRDPAPCVVLAFQARARRRRAAHHANAAAAADRARHVERGDRGREGSWADGIRPGSSRS
jgi:catechol 2,3-dioxygenase-like lactoylglutathione lyase family enzyme